VQVIVAEMLERRIKDVRLGFVTVTDVRVTGDTQHASIFYTVLGDDEQRKASAAALESAKGLIRSEVLLPEGLSVQLSDAELQTILAHELAHIRRKDNLSGALTRVLGSIFWFHPLLWWMERRLLTERELACDELVLANGALREDYLAGILKVCYSVTGVPLAAGRGYAGINGSNLQSRMENIMMAGSTKTNKILRTIPAGLAVLLIAIPLGLGFAQQRPAPAQASSPKSPAEALIESAMTSFKAGRFAEAEVTFRRAHEVDPASFVPVAGLAEALRAQQKAGEAIRFLEAEIARNPGRSDLQVALGNVLVRTENF